MKKVLIPLAYIAVVGFIITVSLAVSIWGLSKWNVEREYLTLDERVRFAVVYPALGTPEKKFAFAKSQLHMSPPLFDFSRSLAADCEEPYRDFEIYIGKTADIAVRYGGADLRLTDVNDDDLIRLDIYTRTAFEFLAEYNACAHR